MAHIKFKTGNYEQSFNQLFNELIDGIPALLNEGNRPVVKTDKAPVNIRESEQDYQLELVAPGFEKTDFKIDVEGNLLIISGERKNEEKKDTLKQIRREYTFRSFKRSFTIDEEIDATGIEASYINGVLTLNLPKKKEVKEAKKEIKIK